MASAEVRSYQEVQPHHEQRKVCGSRAKYREGRRPRAVRVYTVNLESRYLLVQGVPAIGVMKELVEQFALYGAIEEYNVLDEYPTEEFTEVYLIKFQRLQSARVAKRKLDERSFFGGLLHICYAPEFESVQEAREKLQERRRYVARSTSDKDHHAANKRQEASGSSSLLPVPAAENWAHSPSCHLPVRSGEPPAPVCPLPTSKTLDYRQQYHPPLPTVTPDDRQGYPPPPTLIPDYRQGYPPPPTLIPDYRQGYPPPPTVTPDYRQGYPPPPTVTPDYRQGYPPPPTVTPDYRQGYPPPHTVTPYYRQGYPPLPTVTPDYRQDYPRLPTVTPDYRQDYPRLPTLTPDYRQGNPPPPTLTPNYRQGNPPPPTVTPDYGQGYPPPPTVTPDYRRGYPPSHSTAYDSRSSDHADHTQRTIGPSQGQPSIASSARFMPRTTQLQERQKRREERTKRNLLLPESQEIVIGPKRPDIPKVDMADESLNISAELIRGRLKEVSASCTLTTAQPPAADSPTAPPVKQRRRI